MLGIELSIFGVGLLGLKVGFELLAFTFSGQIRNDVDGFVFLPRKLGVAVEGVYVLDFIPEERKPEWVVV